MNRWGMGWVLGLCFLGPAAQAAEAEVSLEARVVYAARAGNDVEPSLRAARNVLAKKVLYGTFKSQAVQRIQVRASGHTLVLPNGKSAVVKLESLANDVATLKVLLPPLDTTYQLGRKGSLYVPAGTHESGELWLILSPLP